MAARVPFGGGGGGDQQTYLTAKSTVCLCLFALH